jgi:outer membrane protein assembly factor BamD (BamD/ComL family)
MLRPSLHLTLVAALSAASLTLPAPAKALAPAVDPDALYEEGRKDFSQGFFKSAIEKFEAA